MRKVDVGLKEVLVAGGVAGYLLWASFQLGAWIVGEETSPKVAPIVEETISLHPDTCLMLVRGENREPDYVLGVGEECR